MDNKSNPQKENGYTAIANEIIEALAYIRISGEEMQVLWVILRKTYGWNKKEDKISLSQFSQLTGIKRPNVARALKKLQEKSVINKDTTYITSYSFNKDLRQWKGGIKKDTSKKVLSKKILGGIKKDNKSVINNDTHKRNKTTITKETIYNKNSKEIFLAELLRDLIRERDPKLKEPKIQKWADAINKINRLDKREWREIELVLRWSQQDQFWQNNILSPIKLRKHFQTLLLKIKSSKEFLALEDKIKTQKTKEEFINAKVPEQGTEVIGQSCFF